MDMAAYVLQEIAGRNGEGGAEARLIRTLVDRRQGLDLEEDELAGALELLEERGLVARVADRYVLSAAMRLRVPKEPGGATAMSRQAWIRLCGSLGLAGGSA
jgi:hypothetical protein